MKYSLMIASAFYEVKAYAPYIISLVNTIQALTEAKVTWTYIQICGDSYVDRAKNSLVHKFLQSDFTHLMIIDSDMGWDVTGFARLLKASMSGAEVVGGLYPCKNNWKFFGGIPKTNEDGLLMGKEFSDIRLLDMYCVPGGFIIYSREAFERTRPLLNTYEDKITGDVFLEAFRCNIEKNGGRVGEDVYFQQRYKEAGGVVWCEPNITISHYGVQEWTGNYHENLMEARGLCEPPSSTSE